MSANIKLPLSRSSVLTVLQILASGAELEKPGLAGSERELLVTCRWLCGDRGGRSGLSLLAGGLWAAVLVYVTWRVDLPNLSVETLWSGAPNSGLTSLLAYHTTAGSGPLPEHRALRPPLLPSPPKPRRGGTAGIDGRAPASQVCPRSSPRPSWPCGRHLWAAAGETAAFIRGCYAHRLGGRPEAPPGSRVDDAGKEPLSSWPLSPRPLSSLVRRLTKAAARS